MEQGRLHGIVLLLVALVTASGCGRPTLPGQHFRGEQVETSVAPESTGPLPKEPFFERGPAQAKVRIVAFFPIDDAHEKLMDLLKGLVDEYRGKVYLKYVDPRTSEGEEIMLRAKMTSFGLLINNTSELEIEAEPNPYTIDFVQEMGRYWTADDLKAAVSQTVAKEYGTGAGASR